MPDTYLSVTTELDWDIYIFLLITISSNFVLQPTGSVQWTANNRGKLKLISFHYFSSCFLTSCFHTHTHTHQVFLMNPGSQGLISWSIISLFCEICFFLCCIRSLQGPQRREKIQPLCMKRLAAIHIHQSWSKCCNLCKWKCLLANHSFLSVEWILMTAGDMVEQCRSGADQAEQNPREKAKVCENRKDKADKDNLDQL